MIEKNYFRLSMFKIFKILIAVPLSQILVLKVKKDSIMNAAESDRKKPRYIKMYLTCTTKTKYDPKSSHSAKLKVIYGKGQCLRTAPGLGQD